MGCDGTPDSGRLVSGLSGALSALLPSVFPESPAPLSFVGFPFSTHHPPTPSGTSPLCPSSSTTRFLLFALRVFFLLCFCSVSTFTYATQHHPPERDGVVFAETGAVVVVVVVRGFVPGIGLFSVHCSAQGQAEQRMNTGGEGGEEDISDDRPTGDGSFWGGWWDRG